MDKVILPVFTAQGRDVRVDPYLKQYPAGLFDDQLYQSIELMERYTIELAVDLLGRLGLVKYLHQWRTPQQLCSALNFRPQFAGAISWLLRRVLPTGLLETRSEHGEHRLLDEPWEPQLPEVRQAGLEISARNAPTLDLLDYVAGLYPAVARGELSGEDGLFGPRGITLWLAYFSNENLTYAVNNWVGALTAANHLGTGAKLRLLEIGAGAGSASEILLGRLAEQDLLSRIESYVITEPNAFLQRRAQRLLASRYPTLPLRYSALDMNRPWAEQGVSAGEFDVVYAVNVMHVAKDLRFTLSEAKRILRPGGWLVIGECIRPFPEQPMYPELIFQILDSFNDVKLEPPIRPNSGFLTPEQWKAAFSAVGFENVALSPDIEVIRGIYRNFFTGAIAGENRQDGNGLR